MQEKISVIIPARGEAESLSRCVASVLANDYPVYDVIIVDDGLGDAAARALLEGYGDKVKVLKSGSRGPSLARNLAAKYTDAESIAFTDSDCIVDKAWLAELAKGLALNPQAVSCGGIQLLPEDAADFERAVFLFMQKAGMITDYVRRTAGSGTIEVNHNPSCNVMYRRQVFLEEGGFLEGLWPAEDVEFDYRLKKKGYRLFCNPRAVVWHYKPKGLGKFLQMMHRYGMTQGYLVRRQKRIFRRVQAMPFLISSGILAAFFLPQVFLKIIMAVVLLFLFGLFNFNISLVGLALAGGFYWNTGFFRGLVFNQH